MPVLLCSLMCMSIMFQQANAAPCVELVKGAFLSQLDMFFNVGESVPVPIVFVNRENKSDEPLGYRIYRYEYLGTYPWGAPCISKQLIQEGYVLVNAEPQTLSIYLESGDYSLELFCENGCCVGLGYLE